MLPIATALLGLIASMLLKDVSSQQPTTCFTTGFDDKYVYLNDIVAFDLAPLAAGNNLEFKLAEGSTTAAQIQNTFGTIMNQASLDQNYSNCKKFSPVTNEQYAFICNQSMVVFATYDDVNGSLTKSTGVNLGSDIECHSIGANKHKFTAYAACLNVSKTNDIPTLQIIAIDTVTAFIKSVTEINQTETKKVDHNVTLFALSYKIEKNYSTFLYVFIDDDSSEGFKTYILRDDQDGRLDDPGFFLTGQNITNLNKEDKFLSMRKSSDNLLLFMRNKTSQNIYVQECAPAPVFNTLQCYSRISELHGTKHLFPSTIGVHRLDKRDFEDYEWIALANSTNLLAYKYTFMKGAEIESMADLSKVGFSVPTASFLYDDRLYLTGQAADGGNIILIYRMEQNTTEFKKYSKDAFSLSFVRKGVYDTDVDEHIAIADEGKTFTSFIYKPQLIVIPYVDAKSTYIVTVECYQLGQLVNSRNLQLKVLTKINGDGFLSIPESIDAYTTSKEITVPICLDDLEGNAPIIKPILDSNNNFTFSVEYINPALPTSFKGASVIDIEDFFYIGNGLYILETPSELVLASCFVDTKVNNGTCFNLGKTNFFNKHILDAELVGDFIFTLEADDFVTEDHQEIRNNLTFAKRKMDDFSIVLSQRFDGFKTKVGDVKLWGSKVYALIAGKRPENRFTQELMWAEYDINSEVINSTMISLLKLPDTICVNDIVFSPRGGEIAYLSSSCRNQATARIYEVYIDRWGGGTPVARMVRIFSELNSLEFDICPTGENVFVADYDNNIVFALDIAGTEDTKYSYGLREYGVERIKHVHCDQDNKIFQVIGTDSKEEKAKLITYRGET